MRNERKLVVNLTGDEFEKLAERAAMRRIHLADLVRQALLAVLQSDWSPLMSRAAEKAIAHAPTVVRPQFLLRPGQEDTVEVVLRSHDPTEQATRSALAMLVRFDPESCFLEAGTWLLSALLGYVALEPGYTRERSLVSVYREIPLWEEGTFNLFDRLYNSTAGNGYVRENARLLLRKRRIEGVYIRKHVQDTLDQAIEELPRIRPEAEANHIAVTLPVDQYDKLASIAARQYLSLSMLGRAAIARLLHMRPHLALVPNERADQASE